MSTWRRPRRESSAHRRKRTRNARRPLPLSATEFLEQNKGNIFTRGKPALQRKIAWGAFYDHMTQTAPLPARATLAQELAFRYKLRGMYDGVEHHVMPSERAIAALEAQTRGMLKRGKALARIKWKKDRLSKEARVGVLIDHTRELFFRTPRNQLEEDIRNNALLVNLLAIQSVLLERKYGKAFTARLVEEESNAYQWIRLQKNK